jgi:hypothetical protein
MQLIKKIPIIKKTKMKMAKVKLIRDLSPRFTRTYPGRRIRGRRSSRPRTRYRISSLRLLLLDSLPFIISIDRVSLTTLKINYASRFWDLTLCLMLISNLG